MTFEHKTSAVGTSVNGNKRAVGVFADRRTAEQALHELRDSGFDMDRVSIVTRDAERHETMAGAEVRDRVGNKADEGATVGALSGGTLGGLTGLLVGLGTLAIPGIGPIMLAGATATTLATTLAGGAIGAITGGLVGALIGLGIPEERAKVYNDRVARGDYLVIVDGTQQEIAQAEAILHQRGIEEYGVYDAPTPTTSTSPAVGITDAAPNRTHSTMAPTSANATVGVLKQASGFFTDHRDAECAIADLKQDHFSPSQISLVAQNVERQGNFADLDIHNRVDTSRLHFPAERISFLHNRVDRGDYLVIVKGTEDEVRRAASILNRRGIQEFSIADVNATESRRWDNPLDRRDTTEVTHSDPQVVIVDRTHQPQ